MRREARLRILEVRVVGDDIVVDVGNLSRADHGSGPHLLLIAAMVSLARRDRSDPDFSVEARRFLSGEAYVPGRPGVDLDLFAECIGYGGAWDG